MQNKVFSNAYHYILVITSGAVWGLTFSFARIASSEGAHPLGLSFWQALLGGITLLAICTYRRVWPSLKMAEIRRYVVIGCVGTAIPGTIYFYAASKLPAGILAITVTIVPLMTYAISVPLGLDRYQRIRFIGIVLGFIAILFLLIPESSLPDQTMVPWLLLALFASVFYTIENLYVDACIPNGSDMVALLTGSLFVAAIILIPVVLMQDAWVALQYPFTRIEFSILGIGVAGCFAYTMFLLVIKLAGAVFASLSAYVVTMSGVFWGILIFDESHSIWVWLSLLLLLLGMALVNPRKMDGAYSK